MTKRHRNAHASFGKTRLFRTLTAGLALMATVSGCAGDDNDNLKMTWFGISNWGLEVDDLNVVIDGYVSAHDRNRLVASCDCAEPGRGHYGRPSTESYRSPASALPRTGFRNSRF